jgi:hypothetical protein
MPVFVPGGPFIPDEVVQDLEDDQLILFCGAGISIQAGLPSFGGLVEHVYKTLKEPCRQTRRRGSGPTECCVR